MDQPVYTLDPTGANRHAEDAHLRAYGPALRVDLLGQQVWAVADPAVLRTLLVDPRVSKETRGTGRSSPTRSSASGRWPCGSG
jgi:hypothetical protein